MEARPKTIAPTAIPALAPLLRLDGHPSRVAHDPGVVWAVLGEPGVASSVVVEASAEVEVDAELVAEDVSEFKVEAETEARSSGGRAWKVLLLG